MLLLAADRPFQQENSGKLLFLLLYFESNKTTNKNVQYNQKITRNSKEESQKKAIEINPWNWKDFVISFFFPIRSFPFLLTSLTFREYCAILCLPFVPFGIVQGKKRDVSIVLSLVLNLIRVRKLLFKIHPFQEGSQILFLIIDSFYALGNFLDLITCFIFIQENNLFRNLVRNIPWRFLKVLQILE